MTTRIDLEDVESTTSEKFLAIVLTAFLLIGSIWFYVKVDDWVGEGRSAWQYTPAEQQVIDARDAAWKAQEAVDLRVEQERTEVQLAKDALDIALTKGTPSDALETEYQREVSELEDALAAATAKRTQVTKLEEQARTIEQRHEQRAHDPAKRWLTAGIRLAFILIWFGASLRIVSALRQRRSRFLPLGFAAVATGVITALVFATDYILDYIDPLDLGPIVLSAAGAGATIAAFVGLQRWLARRLTGRRVRAGECAFCGHPVRGSGPHCEGCGRDVVTPCASCGESRRVGSPHCPHCGAA